MNKTIANPSPKEVIGRASECMRRLFDAGLTFEALQKPIDDLKMRKRLVCFWNSGGFKPSTSQERAREIMGRNFFGIEEAITYFQAHLCVSGDQFAALSEVPFSEAILEECKDTHILVAVFPVSILDIKGKVLNLFHNNQDWYKKESFTKDCGEAVWRLVRKTPVPNSISKTWDKQQTLLAENEEVPTARIMVYTIIGRYLATGERLFGQVYIRCSDCVSNGNRLLVGIFNSDGLYVSNDRDDHCLDGIGLASARKPG